MYTSICIGAVINSVKRAFDKYPDSDRPDKSIIDLLELSLKGIDFEFNGKMYQQVCGCAMGKRRMERGCFKYICQMSSSIYQIFG